MTYDLSWTFNINQVPASQDTLQHQGQSALYFLKTNMLTAGWTVVSSSDGSTQGASDLWTSSAALVWNTNAAARSWILLASPIGLVAGPSGSYTGTQSKLYYCIECVGGSSTQYHLFNQTLYSTAPTGGSTTAIPTGGNAQSFNTAGGQYNNGALSNDKFHFAYTSTGGFYFIISKDGQTNAQCLLMLLPLVDVNNYGAIPYPYAVINSILYGDPIGLVLSSLTTNCKNINYDGTAGSGQVFFLSNSSGSTTGDNTNTSGDINGNSVNTPAYSYTNTSLKCFLIGRFPDMFGNTANGYVSGSVSPVSGGVQYSLLNKVWLPANAAFSL